MSNKERRKFQGQERNDSFSQCQIRNSLFLIHRAVTVRPPKMLAEYSGATTKFPSYNLSQMIRHSTPQAPSQPRRRPEVPETAAQQDDIIRGIATTEEEQLAQQEGMVTSDPNDSSDDDYQPIPQMPPCRLDHEAGSSSSAPPTPQTDPALLAILEWMRQDQVCQAQEIAATFA